MTAVCRATLNYSPRNPSEGMGGERIEVDILDGRTAGLPGWQECGFELVRHEPALQDWSDDVEIAAVHYAEMEDLARKLTGCDFALISDHVKRTAAEAKQRREQSPVPLVHSDFAQNYQDVVRHSYQEVRERGVAALARNQATSEQVENARRIVMMQFWRNIGPPKPDFPLAFCDARTVSVDEVRPFPYTGYVAGGRRFDALAIVGPASPGTHRWYTFPQMTRDEVVAFRTYDTDMLDDGRTFFTPHSAFRDPEVEVGKPPRSSIELRTVCVFV